MRNDYPTRRRGGKPQVDALSELPIVALLLVMAVLVALFAASGPVLDMLATFNGSYTR